MQQIISGFGTIITDVTEDIQAMQVPVSFSGQDATDIYNAFSDVWDIPIPPLCIMIVLTRRWK